MDFGIPEHHETEMIKFNNLTLGDITSYIRKYLKTVIHNNPIIRRISLVSLSPTPQNYKLDFIQEQQEIKVR